MANQEKNEILNKWLSLTTTQMSINQELERSLQHNHQLSLNEFYVLYFLSQAKHKKLRLQQLQELVGLSQSAMSRLVNRLETKNCGVLQRHACENDRRGVYTSLTKNGEIKFYNCLYTVHETLQMTLSKENLKEDLQFLMKNL